MDFVMFPAADMENQIVSVLQE